jgi:hypothetical protein
VKPISCLFWYEMRAKRRVEKGKDNTGRNIYDLEPLLDSEGKPVFNDNFISFLQVISTFWEQVEQRDGSFRSMLNVFLPGGSLTTDFKTGEQRSRPGYTVVFNEVLGTKFMNQYYNWSQRFGLQPTASIVRTEPADIEPVVGRRTGRSQSRNYNDEDYRDPEAAPTEAVVTIE